MKIKITSDKNPWAAGSPCAKGQEIEIVSDREEGSITNRDSGQNAEAGFPTVINRTHVVPVEGRHQILRRYQAGESGTHRRPAHQSRTFRPCEAIPAFT